MFEGFKEKECLEIYKKMQLIRRFEENALKLGEEGKISGTLHLYIGQEAVAVGACHALSNMDIITSTHRGHGHIIAKGGEVKYMFSELLGRENGYNRGKGGSMHITEPSLGIYGANGIVGASVPIAVGIALNKKLKNANNVTIAFFGDGALANGIVHESMNMAALWKLPIIFACENNLYAMSTSIKENCSINNPVDRAKAYGFPGLSVDGMNVSEVYNATKLAVSRACGGEGPTFIEYKTYRYRDHSIVCDRLKLTYRTNDEIERWKQKCPIKNWGDKLIKNKVCTENELLMINEEIEKIINNGIEFAHSSSLPKPEDSLKDMYTVKYRGIPDKGWLNLLNE